MHRTESKMEFITSRPTNQKKKKMGSGHIMFLFCFHGYARKYIFSKLYTFMQGFSSVQSLNHVWLCDSMDSSTPGFPVHHQLLELAQTHVHWVSDAIQPSHPLLPPSLPAFSLSQHQGLFLMKSVLHIMWPKYWSFSFSISPSNEHPGLISFKMDWLDLLTVQGTLKSLLQHHSSKESIFST